MTIKKPYTEGQFLSRVSMLMHAERDIVVANLSVCLSVRHTLVLYLNECTRRQTLSIIW